MKITEALVENILELSRLSLPEEEKPVMAAQLGRIVEYMDVLGRLDTTGIEPMSHVFPVRNVLREDVVEPSFDRTALLDNAPAADEEAFLTPKSVD